jgi:hypothetical protein
MAPVNRHGLSRNIPRRVQRDVRQRSKFGCVMCRNGFYQLEHILPTFADAFSHEADNICCLCPSCHARVTANQLSKSTVLDQYRRIESQTIEEAGEPTGLRLDSPGRIVVERLAMRFHDSHVLASEQTYAAGRYLDDGRICWVWAKLEICPGFPTGAAIEFTDSVALHFNDMATHNIGSSLATADRRIVMSDPGGVMIKDLGIAIASMCLNSFVMHETAVGTRDLDQMRNVVFDFPHAIGVCIPMSTVD